MVQWAIKLCQFDIEYHPRTAIKAQALEDFIAKFTIPDEDNLLDKTEQWTIKACWPRNKTLSTTPGQLYKLMAC